MPHNYTIKNPQERELREWLSCTCVLCLPYSTEGSSVGVCDRGSLVIYSSLDRVGFLSPEFLLVIKLFMDIAGAISPDTSLGHKRFKCGH